MIFNGAIIGSFNCIPPFNSPTPENKENTFKLAQAENSSRRMGFKCLIILTKDIPSSSLRFGAIQMEFHLRLCIRSTYRTLVELPLRLLHAKFVWCEFFPPFPCRKAMQRRAVNSVHLRNGTIALRCIFCVWWRSMHVRMCHSKFCCCDTVERLSVHFCTENEQFHLIPTRTLCCVHPSNRSLFKRT